MSAMESLRIGATSVAFVEEGRGEPVILLHSSVSSSGQWRALIERLSGRFRVIAPDLYGYGETAMWRGDRPFSLEHEAEIAYALLGRCGEPAHIVGHSYGGAVALHVARERGDLVRSLTVIEPVAFHLLRDGDARDAAALDEITRVAEAIARALATGDDLAGCGRFIDYWSGPGTWSSMASAKRATAAPRVAKVALDFQATLGHPARLADLDRMTVPTLVLHGERSPAPTRRICEHLARVLPEVRSNTIAGAGHMCPLTHREETNRLVAAHLESQLGKRSTASREAGFHQPRRTSWIQQL
jgi:pimeloyl-ACP methyl ester carboxylesterase